MPSVPTTAWVARLPSRGDAWRRRKPAVIGSSLDLKREQLVADRIPSDSSVMDDQPAEVVFEAPQRVISTAFRLMKFVDEDEESDYFPSEEEEVDEEEAELVQLEEEATGSEEEKHLDLRWWESSEDKRKWEKMYRQADATFRRKFGCGIDTPAHPETRRKQRKSKSRHRAYTFVLVSLVLAYLVQLAVVYSASSWAFSMVAWRPSTSEITSLDRDEGSTVRARESIKPTASVSQPQVPEHVRTGLHLCATLSRRVVKSEHDVTSTQHALRACDLAVKFAPLYSREAIEARVLRGDLLSLLSRFDGADEDYHAAQTLVLEMESSAVDYKLALGLSQDIDVKVLANRWTQLYKTKSFKELRREAKALAVRMEEQGDDSPASAVSELAADWLSAFKRKKPTLDVLTRQRTWTLRRLKYEVLNDEDNNTKPDAV